MIAETQLIFGQPGNPLVNLLIYLGKAFSSRLPASTCCKVHSNLECSSVADCLVLGRSSNSSIPTTLKQKYRTVVVALEQGHFYGSQSQPRSAPHAITHTYRQRNIAPVTLRTCFGEPFEKHCDSGIDRQYWP